MKNYSVIFLIFLCIAFIFTTGCTSQGVSPSPTPEPTSNVVAEEPTPTQTPGIVTDTIPPVVINNTPSPKADPTNVSEITFLHYSGSDFSVDYPSTWNITNLTYTPYYCESVLDESRNDYHVCFENETKLIGPFYFWQNDRYQKPYRIVMFTSPDGKLKFSSVTVDFLDSLVGNYMLKRHMDWTKAQFESRYPGLLWTTHITNFKYFQADNQLVSTFDVKLPAGSKYYPSAYSQKAMVTVHHVYTFAFITDDENFNKYQNLKDRIMASIKSTDNP